MWLWIQAARSLVSSSFEATATMVVTASSTPGALRRPLRRRNTTMVTKAHRSFPSGSAWLSTSASRGRRPVDQIRIRVLIAEAGSGCVQRRVGQVQVCGSLDRRRVDAEHLGREMDPLDADSSTAGSASRCVRRRRPRRSTEPAEGAKGAILLGIPPDACGQMRSRCDRCQRMTAIAPRSQAFSPLVRPCHAARGAGSCPMPTWGSRRRGGAPSTACTWPPSPPRTPGSPRLLPGRPV